MILISLFRLFDNCLVRKKRKPEVELIDIIVCYFKKEINKIFPSLSLTKAQTPIHIGRKGTHDHGASTNEGITNMN